MTARLLGLALAVCVALAGSVQMVHPVLGYERYNDGCQNCHGHFAENSISPGGTIFPNGSNHTMHRSNQYMGASCTACHSQGDGNNPFLGTAIAGPSCNGCHGRDYGGTLGDRAVGLRAHHAINGVSCSPCHDDDPAPLPENVLPSYYGTDISNVNDPCNADGSEDWSLDAAGIGIDNDGDNIYDGTDLDCTTGQPVNDNCGDATPVSTGSFGFTNIGATTDGPDEPGSCNFFSYTNIDSDVWFRYTATCNGTATVSLCGSGYDTKMAVYGSTCPVSAGLTLACNDDSCDLQSEVSFTATAGAQYLIRIGGYNGAQGSGTMEITCGGVEPCLADTNEDGNVDANDLTNVIQDWGTDGSGHGGDVDGSGTVDVDDLTAVILAWGACP